MISRYQIATIVLAILLVAGGVFAGFKITGLSQGISTLESRYAELQSAYNLIKEKEAIGTGLTVDPSSIDLFDKFHECISWSSLDGFDTGGDTGFVAEPQGSYLLLGPGAQVNYDAWVKSKAFWVNILDAGKLVTVEFPLYSLTTPANQNIWLRFASDVEDPPSEIVDHFGWKIDGGDLYASNADGTTQAITDTTVDLATGNQRTRLKIVLNPGTDCKFYVNDVLKATHDTNLPALASYKLHVHVRTLAPQPCSIELGGGLIEKEN